MPKPRLIITPSWFDAPQIRYPDAASVARRQFTSVAEAEEYAGSVGVSGVNYENRLDIAQLANEFLARLQDRGLDLPVTVMVHSRYFEQLVPHELLSVIPAMADNGVVFLNPHADFWLDQHAHTTQCG